MPEQATTFVRKRPNDPAQAVTVDFKNSDECLTWMQQEVGFGSTQNHNLVECVGLGSVKMENGSEYDIDLWVNEEGLYCCPEVGIRLRAGSIANTFTLPAGASWVDDTPSVFPRDGLPINGSVFLAVCDDDGEIQGIPDALVPHAVAFLNRVG